MNRRSFLKGFLAVTGTLAVAPGIALAPVESAIPIVPDISRMITEIKPDVFPLDTLLREFRERRNVSIKHFEGTRWETLAKGEESFPIIELT